MKTTVVLVHGAWHGAWCFDRVIPLLEEAGVPALAVDLPGHGGDEGPFTDLHGDAAYVWATLDGIDGEVVLLGHSYSGAVITEAGGAPISKAPGLPVCNGTGSGRVLSDGSCGEHGRTI